MNMVYTVVLDLGVARYLTVLLKQFILILRNMMCCNL